MINYRNLFSRFRCIYCNEPANSRDHVVPRSYANELGQSFDKKNVVPSCKNCNAILGNKPYFTISERAGYIARRLYIKGTKLRRTAWTGEEAKKELDGKLRRKILGYIKAADKSARRVKHAELVMLYEDLTIDEFWNIARND